MLDRSRLQAHRRFATRNGDVYIDVDARHILPSITTPTLVLQTAGDRVCHVENGRYLAAGIEGAVYVELRGNNHVPWANGGDEVVPEIQELLRSASAVHPRHPWVSISA